MKIVKAASGNKIKISKKEWESLGKTAGWMKVADGLSLLPQLKEYNKGNAWESLIYYLRKHGYTSEEAIVGDIASGVLELEFGNQIHNKQWVIEGNNFFATYDFNNKWWVQP